MAKFCTQCGAELQPEQTVCEQCSALFRSAGTQDGQKPTHNRQWNTALPPANAFQQNALTDTAMPIRQENPEQTARLTQPKALPQQPGVPNLPQTPSHYPAMQAGGYPQAPPAMPQQPYYSPAPYVQQPYNYNPQMPPAPYVAPPISPYGAPRMYTSYGIPAGAARPRRFKQPRPSDAHLLLYGSPEMLADTAEKNMQFKMGIRVE